MRKATLFLLLISLSIGTSKAQLEYNSFFFDGYQGAQLESVTNLSMTPDGKFVFVISFQDESINVFKRESDGGLLDLVVCYRTDIDGFNSIYGPFGSAVSKDGKYLYVTAAKSEAIFVYEIDSGSGFLKLVAKYKESNVIRSAKEVLVSKNNQYLYVSTDTGSNSNLLVFKRNQENGKLSLIQEVRYQMGLRGISEMVESSDGRFIYTASSAGDAVGIFKVDSLEGTLESIGGVVNGYGGVQNMDCPRTLCLSNDGQYLFVGTRNDNSILTFKRDVTSGMLEFHSKFIVEDHDDVNIRLISQLILSTTGQSLCVVSWGNGGAVSVLSIDAESGELTFDHEIRNVYNSRPNISAAKEAILSNDGKHLYVTSIGYQTLSVFDWDELNKQLELKLAIKDGQWGNIQGLRGANSIALTQDEKYLYCAATNDGSVSSFRRNSITGKLTQIQELNVESDTILILRHVNQVILSPDDKYLYASSNYNAILVFLRDPLSGELTYQDAFTDYYSDLIGLNGVWYMAISDDGEYLYSSSRDNNCLNIFSRDLETGNLTHFQSLKNEDSQDGGLNSPTQIQVSKSNQYIYIGSEADNSISVYQRNPETDSLFEIQQINNGDDGIGNMDGVMSLLLSKDDKFLYVLSLKCNSIFCFKVDPISGQISFHDKYWNQLDTDCIDLTRSQALSPDGSRYYLPSRPSGLMFTYERDTLTGELSLIQILENKNMGVVGLTDVTDVVATQDNKHVYFVNNQGDGISVFNNINLSTAVDDIVWDECALKVYPNPSQGKINLSISDGAYYDVFNSVGQWLIRSNKSVCSLMEYPNGIYYFIIYQKNQIESVEKIVLHK